MLDKLNPFSEETFKRVFSTLDTDDAPDSIAERQRLKNIVENLFSELDVLYSEQEQTLLKLELSNIKDALEVIIIILDLTKCSVDSTISIQEIDNWLTRLRHMYRATKLAIELQYSQTVSEASDSMGEIDESTHDHTEEFAHNPIAISSEPLQTDLVDTSVAELFADSSVRISLNLQRTKNLCTALISVLKSLKGQLEAMAPIEYSQDQEQVNISHIYLPIPIKDVVAFLGSKTQTGLQGQMTIYEVK